MRFFNPFTSTHTEIVNKKSVDAALCGRSERSQNRTDATPCLSDVYNIGTRAKRRLADVRLSGRSMVEMLGVLAIIGVLSVGAIAGYSKAMMKYKINKMTEQYNQIINAMIIYAKEFDASGGDNPTTEMFVKLGEIPKEMITSNKSLLKDVFGNRVTITSESKTDVLYLFYHSGGDDLSLSVCRQFFTIAKGFHGQIYRVEAISNWNTEDVVGASFDGDETCSRSRRCLKDASLEEIETICREHIKQNGSHLKIRVK